VRRIEGRGLDDDDDEVGEMEERDEGWSGVEGILLGSWRPGQG
jgi:hypothetical protein